MRKKPKNTERKLIHRFPWDFATEKNYRASTGINVSLELIQLCHFLLTIYIKFPLYPTGEIFIPDSRGIAHRTVLENINKSGFP